MVTVASLLEGCGSNGNPSAPGGGNAPSLSTINATAAGGGFTLTIDGASPLASVGGAALVQAGNQSFLVTRTGQQAFNALTAVCTHEGCIISGFSSGTFVCPCHGSQFTTSGQVQGGPATRALRTFNAQFTNNVLTVTA
jgi:nitrite reductase/ring-hydroxylating ferredoxin subunit